MPPNISAPQFACFKCRKAFKKLTFSDWMKRHQVRHVELKDPEVRGALERTYQAKVAVCPDCGGAMVEMGKRFRPPKRRDERAWRFVEETVAQGNNFNGWFVPAKSAPGVLLLKRVVKRARGCRG